MGAYVFNVRKSKSVKASFEGRDITVYACTFTCRYGSLPSQMWSDERKYAYPYDALMGRLNNAWNNQRPEFVVIADNEKGIQDGDSVIRWTGGLEWIDTDKIPGEVIGLIRKQGRKWVVELLSDVMLRGEKLLKVLRNGPSPETLWGQTLGCTDRFANAVVAALRNKGLIERYQIEGCQYMAKLGPAAMDRFDKVVFS